ncbi:MAG: F0F1 ATP synthase subunit gamma [Gammaproteobacteria bacterium]
METEETLKRKIDTVSDLHKIVRTMKALSAVSSRHFDGLLSTFNNYGRTVDLGLRIALHGRMISPPKQKSSSDRLAAVIFGSDVGFCGRFNEDLCTHALDKMNGFRVPPNARHILAVGTRVAARLEELGHPIEEIFFTPGSPSGITATVRQILGKLDEWQSQSIEQILLFYSQSGSPHLLHLLPVDLRQFHRLSQEPWPSHVLPIFTLNTEHLLAALLRQHLFICLFRSCAESLASEHQMRLRSMQAAEKNIQDRLDELINDFRSTRQDAIDAELLDIGAGFAAVGNEKNRIENS